MAKRSPTRSRRNRHPIAPQVLHALAATAPRVTRVELVDPAGFGCRWFLDKPIAAAGDLPTSLCSTGNPPVLEVTRDPYSLTLWYPGGVNAGVGNMSIQPAGVRLYGADGLPVEAPSSLTASVIPPTALNFTSVAYTDGTNEQILIIFSTDATEPYDLTASFAVAGVTVTGMVSASFNGCIVQLDGPGAPDAAWTFSPGSFDFRTVGGWPVINQSGSVTAAPE